MAMLLPLERLLNTPVMSLQTGAELARIHRVLVDPRDLTVAAYELEGHTLVDHPSFLRPSDVRELSNLGLIVDSSDEFVGLGDVIKIQQVYEFQFDVIGLEVVDDKKHRLGKVQTYNLDSGSFALEQLVVRSPLFKSFSETELLIHRSQIIEVTDERILVRSTATRGPLRQTIREYANPFRSSAQPESVDSPYS